jgi:hypothetical protein
LNSQVRTFEINLDITMLKLLMINSYNCKPQPPSEIRQDRRACRGTKAERDYKGVALISF